MTDAAPLDVDTALALALQPMTLLEYIAFLRRLEPLAEDKATLASLITQLERWVELAAGRAGQR